MRRDSFGVTPVAGGSEINGPPFLPGAADQSQNGVIIWEQAVIDIARIGEIGFQLSLAAQQGTDQRRMMPKTFCDRAEIVFIKKVCLDQGSIEIDDKREVVFSRRRFEHIFAELQKMH